MSRAWRFTFTCPLPLASLARPCDSPRNIPELCPKRDFSRLPFRSQLATSPTQTPPMMATHTDNIAKPPNMDPPPPTSTALKAIRHFAAKKLRQEFLFLKTEALEQMLDNVTNSLEHDIKQVEPVMEASKARIDFFSLPPELRDEIYGLAVGAPHGSVEDVLGGPLCSLSTMALVSRQVCVEARALYYANTTLRFRLKTLFYLGEDLKDDLMGGIVKPRARFVKKLLLSFEYPSEATVARDAWDYLGAMGLINLKSIPEEQEHLLKKVDKAMILKLKPFADLGVSPSAVSIEYHAGRLGHVLQGPRGCGRWRLLCSDEADAAAATAGEEEDDHELKRPRRGKAKDKRLKDMGTAA